MPRMSDDDLLSQIEHLERQALGYYTSNIAGEQAKALDYYLGKPFGTEEEGRSSVVSSDVWDVVEGMTPLVLKPFVSSDDVVKFSPVGKDDEDAAAQESEYINWVVTARNNAFTELVSFVKTGLLQKNGVVKWWWEKSERATIERYFGIDEATYIALQQAKGVQVVEHNESIGDDGQTAHDVALRTTEDVGRARYQVVPPEEFLIDRSATCADPQLARFVQHRRRVTLSDLRSMGYDVDDTLADLATDDPHFSMQYQARRGDELGFGSNDEGSDKSLREVTYRETYLLLDFDGDGVAELRKVCAVGRVVLANEEAEEIPFAAWTPYPQPHKFYGRCPADETLEIQLIKSTLWRQSLDNIYTINNNRVYANEDVTLDDLIDNQIAGVVRVKGRGPVGNSVMSAQITPIGAVVQPMIEYLDQAKENRTGFTRYNQGSDANSLNKTATGIRIITENANSRVEIISRAFAEQGLAPLMRGIHGLCRRHATKAETVRLRGEWVEIDPRGWKTRMDLTVSVGLGSQDQQMRMQGLQMLMAEQKMLVPMGLVQPDQMLASAKKLAETVGFKDPDQFFGQKQDEGEQQLPPQVMQALQSAQQEIQQLQQALQEAQSGVQAKQVEVQGKAQLAQMQGAFDSAMQRAKDDAAYDREELKGMIELIKAQIQPPPALVAEVEEDMAEESDGPA